MGESVVEATIAQWLKNPGDTVKAGEDLVELETEKVNQSLQAETDGVLAEIKKQVGDTVGVGDVLGIVSDNGAAATVADAPKAEAAAPVEAKAEAKPETSAAREAGTTPVAGAIATHNNVDLSGISGTGPGGKIGKRDVEERMQAQQTAPAQQSTQATVPPAAKPTPPAVPSTAAGRPEERIRMTRRREVIAERLVQAQHTAAMLTTFNEVDMTAVMDLRKRRKDSFQERFGVGLGFMSFFTKAVIGALKQFPMVNSEIQSNEIVLKKYYDIGIAVGVEEGLVVPVVRDADKMSFAEIEKKIRELAGKAREGKLSLTELQGGTFTITNGGVYGSLMSTPILNYPQVGILGMHTIKERPMVVNGEIVARPMMYLALSYDHRVIDGSTAVQFLVKVKDLIEDPETLLLEG